MQLETLKWHRSDTIQNEILTLNYSTFVSKTSTDFLSFIRFHPNGDHFLSKHSFNHMNRTENCDALLLQKGNLLSFCTKYKK